ncbi:MAG TPA: extracellular solute-binding protein [Puia sp.]|nr:extracellular solute-binding protein [Puia sp.]
MSQIILNGITWDHSRGYDPLAAASYAYEKASGMRVEWRRRSLKDFGDQSLNELAAQFDLLITDYPHSGVAAAAGCLLPLDDYLPADVLATLHAQSAGPSFSSYDYGGHQWALPVDAACQSACYRPDLLKESVPQDWSGVFALARKLAKERQFVGMALCPTDALCSFLSLTAQFGTAMEEEKKSALDERKTAAVLELMRGMRDHFHADSLAWNPVQLYEHMSTQDDLVYSPLAFNYNNYSRTGFSRHLLSYTDPPGKIAVLGGAGIAVSSKTKSRSEAVDFAAWICSAAVQRTVYVQNQGQPANDEAWQDQQANTLTHNFFYNSRQTLLHAYTRPRYAAWPAFQEWLGESLHQFLVNDSDIGQLLNGINERWLASKS